MFDAFLAAGGQAEQVSTTDTAGVGAQRQRLYDMVTAPDTAVTDDLELVAQFIGDRGDAVDRGRRRLELPAAVIGQHDRGCAGIDRFARIADRLDALDDERPVPLAREPFDILPVDRAIELAVAMTPSLISVDTPGLLVTFTMSKPPLTIALIDHGKCHR